MGGGGGLNLVIKFLNLTIMKFLQTLNMKFENPENGINTLINRSFCTVTYDYFKIFNKTALWRIYASLWKISRLRVISDNQNVSFSHWCLSNVFEYNAFTSTCIW